MNMRSFIDVSAQAVWVEHTLIIFIKGMLILLAAAGIVFILRRSSAALRHTIWVVSLCSLLILPALTFVLPAWEVIHVYFGRGDEQRSVSSAQTILWDRAMPEASPWAPNHANVSDDDKKPMLMLFYFFNGLLLLWGIGTLKLCVNLFKDLRSGYKLSRKAKPLWGEQWASLSCRAANQVGLRRPVRLLQCDEVHIPATWGLWKPIVLLPASANTWTREQQSMVLLHEYGHIKRCDYLTNLLTYLAFSVHWLNPLVWVAHRKLRLERERACDDYVLRAGIKASDYAAHLVGIARFALAEHQKQSSLSILGSRELDLRIKIMLAQTHNPLLAGRQRVLFTAALALIVVPLLAMISPAAPVDASDPIISEEYDQAHATTCVSSPGNLAVSDTQKKARTYNWTNEKYTVEAQSYRKVSFPSTSRIQVEAEGSFALTEWSAGTARRLRCTSDKIGQVNQRYWVDGQLAPFDAEARSWLAKALYKTGLSDDVRYIWTSGQTHYNVRIKGQIIFAEAGNQIQVIPEHGYFVLEEQAERTRTLKVVPASNGSLSFTYMVDDQPHFFDDRVQAWLADVLPEVVREMRASR